MGKIEFNEELHEYKLDGQVIPGVTGILKATGFYNHPLYAYKLP